MSKFKTYFKDYSETEKVCKEFRRKHWFGNLILTLVVWILTLGSFYGIAKIKEIKEEKK